MSAAACRKGHPRTAENTYVSPRGVRDCRTCRQERAAARREARREARGVKPRAPRVADVEKAAGLPPGWLKRDQTSPAAEESARLWAAALEPRTNVVKRNVA